MVTDFSVLISVFKGENPFFLKESLNSILNQTLKPREVILIEDGPLTNELYGVIEEFGRTFDGLRICKQKDNGGLGTALRAGLELCKYDLVARMDSDDVAMESRFEQQCEFLAKNKDIHILGGHVIEFEDSRDKDIRIKKVPVTHDEIVKFSKLRNPINHPTVMFRKSAVLAVGSYKHMPLFEDYYLWLRLIKAGYKFANLDSEVLYFRVLNMHKKRHGLAYFKKEVHFFRTVKSEKLITYSQFWLMLVTRLPFRILPRPVLSLIYNSFLREGGWVSNTLKRL